MDFEFITIVEDTNTYKFIIGEITSGKLSRGLFSTFFFNKPGNGEIFDITQYEYVQLKGSYELYLCVTIWKVFILWFIMIDSVLQEHIIALYHGC